MAKRLQRQISVTFEDEEIINKYFPYGAFSKFVSEKLKEFQLEREKTLIDKSEMKKLKVYYDSAVRVLNKHRGSPMMLTYAKRWEGIIREQGGITTVKQLLELAEKYKHQGEYVNVEV